MKMVAIVLAVAGLVPLIVGLLQSRSEAATDPQAKVGPKPLMLAGGVLLAAAVIVGAAALFSRSASPVCAKAITCCKAAANGQHVEICDNLARIKDDDCRTSLQTFRKVVEQFRPEQLPQCD